MVPPEVAAVLPTSIDAASVSSCARLHASLDSPLGESHLVAAGARLFAVTRRSPFDPFVAVELAPGGATYVEEAFSRKLTLVTAAGATHVMDVSILDVDAIKAFMTAIGGCAPPAAAAAPAPKAVAVARSVATNPLDERSPVRAHLLGVMKSQVGRVRAQPFPGEERYIAPTAALPRIKPPKHTPSPPPVAEPRRTKKKKQRPHNDGSPRTVPVVRDAGTNLAPPADGPLFRTGHWIALLVVAPLIFLAFVYLARAMR